MPSTFHDKKAPAVNPPSQHTSQFGLLKQRRFAPFFWTQFLGAANDNISKFALTVMVTYQLQLQWLPAAQAGVVIAALFILPFVLFSATSGQLADKFEKGSLMRLVKNFEIAIMALALWGFWHAQVPLLLACVFMMGMHSTLFGPVKFAYLPQQLSERELTGGNGMVEMGTFVAIILGNVLGGLLIGLPEVGAIATGLACLAVAVAGRIAAQFVPHSPATDPQLRINWNPFTETWNNLKLAYQDKVVFRSLVGISWMWFFGVVFLANFPSFAKEVLHGQSAVASLLMVVFSVGVGIGALLCELLSRRHVEIGLAPLGALGMTVFAVDLYFASRGLPAAPLLGVAEFLSQPAHWRVLLDLGMLALSAGLYSVPMYALIQLRSQPSHRARIIAANNILNALFMIASSLGAGVLIGAGFSIPEVFLTVGLINLAMAVYICVLVPEYLLRAIAFVCSRLRYRLGHSGTGAIPATGAALLLLESKPVSASHALLLTAASPRSINFFMARPLVARPVAGWLWRATLACPLAPPELALRHARQRLTAGELVCLGQADAGAAELLEKLRKA
ncbi:MAG: MFS transporter, partial [Burkholderiaceae bacterium]|nr:MFS transporter [Burkholderiaceae bacterium]